MRTKSSFAVVASFISPFGCSHLSLESPLSGGTDVLRQILPDYPQLHTIAIL